MGNTKPNETQEATIYQKLAAFQTKIDPIKKDAVNPHFKSNYATLAHILSKVKPLLNEVGLILLQPISAGNVETILIDKETGQQLSSEMPLPCNLTPQQTGSAITYYRRYLLAGMLSLEIDEDDDDGNAAEKGAKGDEKNSARNGSEPTDWLNLFTRDGKETDAFWTIKKLVGEGNAPTLAQIKSKYKISKQTAEELKSNFNIQ